MQSRIPVVIILLFLAQSATMPAMRPPGRWATDPPGRSSVTRHDPASQSNKCYEVHGEFFKTHGSPGRLILTKGESAHLPRRQRRALTNVLNYLGRRSLLSRHFLIDLIQGDDGSTGVLFRPMTVINVGQRRRVLSLPGDHWSLQCSSTGEVLNCRRGR